MGPIEAEINTLLDQKFSPDFLQVMNESHQHSVAPGSESHFRVIIVSSEFDGKMLIDRHRLVNESLSALLKDKIHALALVTKTPSQWKEGPDTGKSPKCVGKKV